MAGKAWAKRNATWARGSGDDDDDDDEEQRVAWGRGTGERPEGMIEGGEEERGDRGSRGGGERRDGRNGVRAALGQEILWNKGRDVAGPDDE